MPLNQIKLFWTKFPKMLLHFPSFSFPFLSLQKKRNKRKRKNSCWGRQAQKPTYNPSEAIPIAPAHRAFPFLRTEQKGNQGAGELPWLLLCPRLPSPPLLIPRASRTLGFSLPLQPPPPPCSISPPDPLKVSELFLNLLLNRSMHSMAGSWRGWCCRRARR